MPIIINSKEQHPFLGGAIESTGIRPAHIVIVNLMANKEATEQQLGLLLNRTSYPVRVTLATTNSYMDAIRNGSHVSKNTDVTHIKKFYNAWRDIKNQKIDGLIITGFNALQHRVQDEKFYGEICEILDHSKQNISSSLFLCWGAKAALNHFYGIESIKGEEKTYGVYKHKILTPDTKLMQGIPPHQEFDMPVSRWKNPDVAAIQKCADLRIIGLSEETGANVIISADGKQVYLIGHPEYATNTLQTEFKRDSAKAAGLNQKLPNKPQHYDLDNPVNSWAQTGIIYKNWLDNVCELTAKERAKPFVPAQTLHLAANIPLSKRAYG